MDLISLDYESYYDSEYTLSKMTTESYVRDPRFEAIMVGIKINDERSYTVVGEEIGPHLHSLPISRSAMLCHHSHFDGLILSHHYGLAPKIWFDTLPMGRAELGSVISRGMSLGSMAEHLGIGKKGHEVVQAKGKHLSDFSAHELSEYRRYCCNDVDLTYAIYQILMPKFSVPELKLVDLTTRLFTEPVLDLNTALLEEYREQVLRNKDFLMLRAGVTREDLMSNNRFANILRGLGVEPEMKDSATAKMPDGTPKRTYAFAKTDDAMKRLVEHDDETVRVLAEARLGVKTSIAETRAKRFIDMSNNGSACVYLKYWGAEQTGRHGGGDSCNWQNLGRSVGIAEDRTVVGRQIFTTEGQAQVIDPGLWGITGIATSKGQFKTKSCHQLGLRDAVQAPEGMVLVVGDSSNIEARMVCWIAGQEDILEKYRAGEDLYCEMASDTYGYPCNKKDHPKERQLGKVAVLGLGFGMGKDKFYDTATGSQWRIEIERHVTDTAVDVFRAKYDKVVDFWEYLNDYVIPAMADGREIYADPRGLIRTCKDGLILPNGRTLKYPNLHQRKNPDPDSYFKTEWVFDVREGARIIKTRLYGGKLCVDGGAKVLTNLGWVALKDVTVEHLVYDGVDFVSHGGIIYKGVQDCVAVDGVLMTPDHEVLTNEGWKAALEKPRPYRPDLRHVGSAESIWKRREKDGLGVPVPMRVGMYQDGYGRDQGRESREDTELWVRDKTPDAREEVHPRYVPTSGLFRMAQYGRSLPLALSLRVEELRRAGYTRLCGVGAEFRDVLARYAAWVSIRAYSGTQEQRTRILQGQLLLGHPSRTGDEPAKYCSQRGYTATFTGDRDKQIHSVLPAGSQSPTRAVYDILDCGPRHRFVVQGKEGPFVVHNCENIVQALARIVVLDQAVEISHGR